MGDYRLRLLIAAQQAKRNYLFKCLYLLSLNEIKNYFKMNNQIISYKKNLRRNRLNSINICNNKKRLVK